MANAANKPLMSADDQARLERVKAILSTVPEGKELLDLAERLNVPIIIDAKIDSTAHLIYDTDGVHTFVEIALAPNENENDMAAALGHELRHLWQYTRLNVHDLMLLSLQDQMVLTRIMEGDAFAFGARLEKALSVKPFITPLADGMIDEIKSGFKNIGHTIKDPAPENATLCQGWLRDFISFQLSEYSLDYDETNYSHAKKISRALTIARFFKPDADKARELTHSFNHSAADLRLNAQKITVAGLDDTAPAYLEFVDNKKMLDALSSFIDERLWEKAGHLNAKILVKAQKLQK